MRLGTDIIEIERIRKSIARTHFVRRIFTDAERAYLAKKKDPAPSAAGMFAAKEAFAKAVGTGFRGFSPGDVSVEHTDAGAPFYRLYGGAAAAAKGWRFTLSISHCKQYAVACAAAEKEVDDGE